MSEIKLTLTGEEKEEITYKVLSLNNPNESDIKELAKAIVRGDK